MMITAKLLVHLTFGICNMLATLTLNLCALFAPIAMVGGIGLLVASFFVGDPMFYLTLCAASFGAALVMMGIQGVLERV